MVEKFHQFPHCFERTKKRDLSSQLWLVLEVAYSVKNYISDTRLLFIEKGGHIYVSTVWKNKTFTLT